MSTNIACPVKTHFNIDDHELIHIEIGSKDEVLKEKINELKKLGFPHISEKLTPLIGCVEFEQAITKLVISDRPNRKGFPKEVLTLILQISSLHFEIYPFEDK